MTKNKNKSNVVYLNEKLKRAADILHKIGNNPQLYDFVIVASPINSTPEQYAQPLVAMNGIPGASMQLTGMIELAKMAILSPYFMDTETDDFDNEPDPDEPDEMVS